MGLISLLAKIGSLVWKYGAKVVAALTALAKWAWSYGKPAFDYVASHIGTLADLLIKGWTIEQIIEWIIKIIS